MKSAVERAIRKRFKAFSKSERGATAVEFAMLGIPFFWIFMVIFETGAMLFAEYSIQASVQQAARLVRTGQATNNALSQQQFKDEICEMADIVIDCTKLKVYVNNYPSFTALRNNLPDIDAIATSPPTFAVGGSLQSSAVVATYDWNFITPFMGGYVPKNSNTPILGFGNINGGTARRLVGITIFRNEPF
jgi:Flp pilus assembly protein TadG